MKKIIFLIFLISLNCFASQEKAEKLEKEEKYLEAITEYKILYTKSEDKEEKEKWILKILDNYYLSKNYTEGEKFANDILKKEENIDEIYWYLGKYYELELNSETKERLKEKAKKYMYDNYLKYANKTYSEEAIYYLGNLYFKDNLYEKSLEIFSKDKSKYYKNLFGKALCERIMGEYKDSISTYTSLIEEKPNFEEAYLGRGISYKMLEKYDLAISDYKRYLTYKKDENIYEDLAIIYILKKDYQNAALSIEDGLVHFPDSSKLRELNLEIFSLK